MEGQGHSSCRTPQLQGDLESPEPPASLTKSSALGEEGSQVPFLCHSAHSLEEWELGPVHVLEPSLLYLRRGGGKSQKGDVVSSTPTHRGLCTASARLHVNKQTQATHLTSRASVSFVKWG